MSLVTAVKQANRPGPPEESVGFRVAAAGAVVVAVIACMVQGELGPVVAWVSVACIVAGNVLSYRRRSRPVRFLKPALALAVLGAFGWFFVSVSHSASAGDLTSVEGPLAVLFTLIQVTHAFDVPSRRDLGFSLAGSATLMAVAAAQAIDATYGLFVVAWAAFGFAGLLAMWGSMAGGSRVRPVTAVVSVLSVVVVGVVVVGLLPAPHADSSLVLPTAIANDLPVHDPGGLVGGGPKGTEPVHAGSPSGRTGVGGYLGFAGPLDTAIRGTLGHQVVFQVRADRPSYWIAETFNQWTGQSWVEAPAPKGSTTWHEVSSGSPFLVPPAAGQPVHGQPDYQTFYLSEAGPNLVFHAADAAEVWFPSRRIFVSSGGTVRSGTSMGPGSIYTVLSVVQTATPAELAADGSTPGIGEDLPAWVRTQSLQLPHPYPRVASLAERITAHAHSTYQKILALELWMGHHTRYTLDIPPLAPGQDTVDQFLFGSRRGYCEQISTSLAVMLRTLGIPAREATGYVPGPYNPLTDLYQVQADDAHAWVQVWFPGYGWQSFDPTADVPFANPSPADALGHDVADVVRRVPVVPVVVVLVAAGVVTVLVRRRRRRPPTWAAAITRELERAARKAALSTGPGETLLHLADRLDATWSPPTRAPPPGARSLALEAERAAFGGTEPDPTTRQDLLAAARRLRRAARPARTDGVSPPSGPPAPRRSSPRQPAGAGRP